MTRSAEHDPARLRDAVSAAGAGMDLGFRPMFGGVMAYVDGRPFASLSAVGLALKLDEPGRRDLLAIEGARPLQYTPSDPPSRSYVLVPEVIYRDADTLRRWLDRSAAAVAVLPQRTSKRKRQTGV